MLGRVVLYTKRMPEMVHFYCTHFGFEHVPREGDRITELVHPDGGARLMLHKAAKSQKEGQVLVKLVFDCIDVATQREKLIAAGLKVGPVHDGGGYVYSNLKDPSGNSVSLSSRFLLDGPTS